ncbi:flagellar protein FliS [Alicyclobacillus fastidiosus]|uniref:Flagellar protein FliS n=1 Tax=Alicyclobacillus fastidiosus TaxID=392011 RepID=A0ABY6ZL55_9BACL|nr:flagellar protein FliS [Alicyclobacillus fastidiosus]WAH42650.1 flagellar protein FliS [Alicyclobacillus fastidiosus]GMA64526.1 hypothetical protein GCM10025859_49660 [Alicyclobacillus fastidiosus]
MNPANAYRNAIYTTPLHVQLSQLHRQAGVFTRQVKEFVECGDIQSARKHIEYVQDIIAFLRSSLDMSLEVSKITDNTYAYYYNVLVRWFLEPNSCLEDFQDLISFWDSWADTWVGVGSSS